MADYYMLTIMVHLWNRGTKNEPEDKELIWVTRWIGGVYNWPANLTSAAFRQANKQNSLTTGYRGCVFTESTEIKRHTQEMKKTLGGGRGGGLETSFDRKAALRQIALDVVMRWKPQRVVNQHFSTRTNEVWIINYFSAAARLWNHAVFPYFE